MTTGLGAAGIRPFSPTAASNDPELQALYDRILAQGGDPETALSVVKTAENWFNDLFNKAILETGGDDQQALQRALQHKDRVMELAGLIPTMTGSNDAAASRDLSRAVSLLNQMGVTDMEPFYGYLRQNVQSDAALQAAGFDVDAVRTIPENAMSHVDKAAVLEILRQLLDGYQATGQIDATQHAQYLEQARQAAEMYGVGSMRVEGSDEAAEADEVIAVAALGIPIRA